MNPVELSNRIKDQYIEYLRTTFYLKDPNLRASFAAELDRWSLAKGPYLQATPTFRAGNSLSRVYQSIFNEMLDPKVDQALTGGRALYSHQEKAISKVLTGRNVVVSTGTGSGKTESFLLPILLDLYRQHNRGVLGPGVRALVLYPMNALANDQRDRLVARADRPNSRGGISFELERLKADFHFSMGQYIGETPENAQDKNRLKSLVDPGVGELAYRDQMRVTPPNILLTNFSMLEYLLLRPDDSPLFDGENSESWTYLVLDEAHQYRGAMGIEMAMLIRRLKQRLREQGCKKQLRCIATSASLVNGEGDIPAVAGFASELFGEPFDASDVILGEPVIDKFTNKIELQPDDYRQLARLLDEGSIDALHRQIGDIARRCGISLQASEAPESLGELLLADRRSAQLKGELSAEPAVVSQLSSKLFPECEDVESQNLLMAQVDLLLNARNSETQNAMLSARLHLFLRSLEGAFILVNPEETIKLERGSSQEGDAGYELALCRECGQHYLVGIIYNGRLSEARRDPSDEEFGADFFLIRNEFKDAPNEDEEVHKLCRECGEVVPLTEKFSCCHENYLFLVQQESAKEREDQIPRCMECGYSGRDPVREVIHGTDGPHAVIATTLHRHLPKGRNKVLAFADGRQEAAFFAWYLEESYKEILQSSLIVNVLKELSSYDGSFTILELEPHLDRKIDEQKLLPKTTGAIERRRNACRVLFSELLTDKLRISPEGVGLIRWELDLPSALLVPECLLEAPWNFTQAQARGVIASLLDVMRVEHAVEICTDKLVALQWGNLGIIGSNNRVTANSPGKKADLKSWAGKTNRRSQLLGKIARSKGVENASGLVEEGLREIWDCLKEHDRDVDSPEDRILIPAGDAFRLNSRYYRIKYVGEKEQVLVCDTCKRISYGETIGCCPRHKCPGHLTSVERGSLEVNHYRNSYELELSGGLRVEEHTAQLDSDKAREYQRAFKEGKINVLSCSTTFELGVDLGDLDTIFLRNVPPEAFNYDQRVGRSGRRRGRPGYAITFCRRGPHDLYHFADPLGMLKGRVRPPVLAIKNPKIILRHLTAYALSAFFRSADNRMRFASVDALLTNLSAPTFARDFIRFLEANKEKFASIFRNLVPADDILVGRLGLSDNSWIQLMAGAGSKLEKAEAEISSDFVSLAAFKERAIAEQNFKGADWAKVRAETIAGDNVLNFLSRKTVIPKYGFPVDVVELDTSSFRRGSADSYSVGLDRDLAIAISEFAPGSQLIANKKLWTSYGLKKVRNKELDSRNYFKCQEHNVFKQWSTVTPEPANLGCSCQGQRGVYVIPAFGFSTSNAPPGEPKGRVAKMFSTRPHFDEESGGEQGQIAVLADPSLLTVTRTRPGRMVVLCEGRKRQKFHICSDCGAGVKVLGKKTSGHEDPLGRKCSGTLVNLALGHEFETDIVQLVFNHPVFVENKLWFAHSLSSALVEAAAEVLEVPSADISATVGPLNGQNLPTIIVYDNVPGGAGLVARLEQEATLLEVLNVAKKRVSGICNCSEDTSCYGCLRSYRNQFVHDRLVRGPVHKYLSDIVAKIEARKRAMV